MLINDLKLLLRFNSTSLYEEVSQTILTSIGGSAPVINDNGYTMQKDQYLVGTGLSENGFVLDIANSMTMGFWLYSVYTGIAVNESTGITSSVETPLFDFVSSNNVEQHGKEVFGVYLEGDCF